MAVSRVALHQLLPHVDPGPTGTFARHLTGRAPDGCGWRSELGGQGVVAVSGQPLGHLYNSFAWVFGPAGPAARALFAVLLDEMRPPLIAFDPVLEADAGVAVGTDLLLVHDGPLPERSTRDEGLMPVYVVDAANAASLALARRVGFRRERELRVVVPGLQ